MKNTPLKKLNIALLGYGRMGKEIEAIAAESGHNICLIIDNESDWLKYGKELSKADVAIDFSLPKAATSNIKKCFTAKVPIVVGTTGWYSNYQDLYALCLETDNCLFHATNFSLGVNIFSAINSRLAEIMNQFPDYSVCLSETHHTEKLDAPSGTAISLAENIIKKI